MAETRYNISMINETYARKYCCEDISKIKNYAEAAADTMMWDLHHRAETDEGLSKKELIAQGRYWNRPTSELIFLTKSAHKRLHYDAGTMENAREAARKTGAENGRKAAEKLTNGICSKKVLQFTLDGTFVREWPSAQEIWRQLKFRQSAICECCNGKRKSAYKYIWRYSSAAPGVHS